MSFDQVTADLIRQIRERDAELAAVCDQANDDKHELDTLREAYATAKLDAERYRWLRARAYRTSDLEPAHWEFPAAAGIGATPDDAIDEEMLAAPRIGAA